MVKVKVKLRFSAPSAGFAEIAERQLSPQPLVMTLKKSWSDLNPACLTVLAAKSVDNNKVPQHLHFLNFTKPSAV